VRCNDGIDRSVLPFRLLDPFAGFCFAGLSGPSSSAGLAGIGSRRG
jgi:hypothetical protein